VQQYKGLSRKELQQKFKEMGSLLIPLLHTSQKNIMRAFDPLPYTELPSVRTTLALPTSAVCSRSTGLLVLFSPSSISLLCRRALDSS
jgi:hypothetical protein